MTRATRLLGLILTTLAPGLAPADAAEPITPARQEAADLPWSDHAIKRHIADGEFTGVLDRRQLDALKRQGEELFTARFTRLDGAGRPMATQAIIPTLRKREPRNEFSRTAGLDANACSSCHHVPIIGGAGDFSANVFVSEGFQHTEFDTTDPQFSNERNTNHLFGAGLVELLAREMTAELQIIRGSAMARARQTGKNATRALSTKGVSFGQIHATPDGIVDTRDIEGVDADLVVRPFSHKGVMTSLRQFTVNALNHHHGIQAPERFGARWTDTADHDADGMADEITGGDISALVAWQASLAPPLATTEVSPRWQAAARRGSALFDAIECNECHRRALPLDTLKFDDPGPVDAAGTLRRGEHGGTGDLTYDLALLAWADTLPRDDAERILVPLFGDLKRHVIADNRVATLGNELLSQRFVERNVFMTSELWGVASTGPYGHRGDLGTLAEVISAHGGEARQSRDDWMALDPQARSDVEAFLKTLVIAP